MRGMSPTNPFSKLFSELRPRTQSILEAGGNAERSLDTLQASISAQVGLSASAKRQAIAALESDRRALKDTRRAELGAEIRSFCSALGLIADIKVAKRCRRKRTPGKASASSVAPVVRLGLDKPEPEARP